MNYITYEDAFEDPSTWTPMVATPVTRCVAQYMDRTHWTERAFGV